MILLGREQYDKKFFGITFPHVYSNAEDNVFEGKHNARHNALYIWNFQEDMTTETFDLFLSYNSNLFKL